MFCLCGINNNITWQHFVCSLLDLLYRVVIHFPPSSSCFTAFLKSKTCFIRSQLWIWYSVPCRTKWLRFGTYLPPVDRLLEVGLAFSSESLTFIYKNTRRHIPGNMQLHTIKLLSTLKSLNYPHLNRSSPLQAILINLNFVITRLDTESLGSWIFRRFASFFYKKPKCSLHKKFWRTLVCDTA
jgi:hypothetical protein